MKSVYICSPYAGDVEQNVKNAEKYSKWVCRLGYLPICVHIYLERATGLHEKNGDRQKLLELGQEFVRFSDEVWVFGQIMSEGMIGEINIANQTGVKVRYIKNVDCIRC